MAKEPKQQPQPPQPQFNINLNPETTHILYTDVIFMNTNEDGIVLDIAQKVGGTNQLQVVSRIGMSRQHAKKFAKKLSELLALTEGQSQTGDRN